MPDIPFGTDTSGEDALGGVTGFGATQPVSFGGLAQVSAPTLLQQISGIGAAQGVGSGQGVGGMNFGMAGSAVTDFFQAVGANAEAQNYSSASQLAKQEAEFTKESTAVQQAQATRQITMTIGAQKAGVAATGFTQSGSALQLLRSSAQQAALSHQMITQQGLITEAGYNEQAKAYANMASAAKTAEVGDIFGGVLNAVGAVVGL